MPTEKIHEWLSALDQQRRTLKMSLPTLAKRTKLSRATVCRILSKKQTSTSIESILAIASVLGAEFKFCIQNPQKVIDQRVKKKAKKIVQMVQGTMALEAQGITDPKFLAKLEKIAAKEIRAKPQKHLWVN